MRVKIYSYKKCSTCQKALKFLADQGIEPEVVDITESPPSVADLKKMVSAYKGEVKKLFNTSGQVYREQKIGIRLPSMTDTEALTLLAQNGRLIKRPFLLVGGEARAVGFKEGDWRKILGK